MGDLFYIYIFGIFDLIYLLRSTLIVNLFIYSFYINIFGIFDLIYLIFYLIYFNVFDFPETGVFYTIISVYSVFENMGRTMYITK